MIQYIDIIRSDIRRFICNYLREGALDGLQGKSDVDAYIADVYPYLCTLYLIRRNYPPEAIEEFVRLHKEILSGETRQLKQTLGYFLTDDVNIEQLKNQLEKLQSLNSSLTEKVTESDSRIAGLVAEITRLTAEKDELQRKVSGADLADKVTEAENNALGIKLIDMGTSVLWADRNLGAPKPHIVGDYYRWGDLKEYNYTEDRKRSETYVKTDDIKGDPAYDAARKKLGEGWSIPSNSEWQELFDVCEVSVLDVEDNWRGSAIVLNSRKTGKSIIIPQSGVLGREDIHGMDLVEGYYYLWSSISLEVEYGYSTQMYCGYNRVENRFIGHDLNNGLNIRPVYTPKRSNK